MNINIYMIIPWNLMNVTMLDKMIFEGQNQWEEDIWGTIWVIPELYK